ncbi:MOSC domain-containing protein [Actinomadura logoneensis]|uniref:MOSC domain-containing protein n=1 Tax=Actinomadura logoneensis TaxID=2293572 RepID=A0A372JMP2_9ACTN|nr:MOSC domain-containing protein [Actinomadura logoneensis]RFU41096.1 MOSC domain-containing protein [Actinomadura logoneensis]
MAFLLSLNIGVPRDNPWQAYGGTGIDKRPVDGPVRVEAPGPKGTGAVGLAGDRVFDVRHHGGDDQAVYAYAREDLDAWAADLGRDVASGSFGENLTTSGVDVNAALVGERWRVGRDVLLEVTSPRIPCRTFAGWMDVPGWIRTFTARALPGTYFRVLEPGDIAAGDAITVEDRPSHGVDVRTVFRALTLESELLPRLLDAGDALPAHLRERAEHRLSRSE